VACAENFHGGFHSVSLGGHLYLECAVRDVIYMLPNQRFGDVCWHNMYILLHALSLFFMALHWIYTSGSQTFHWSEQFQSYDFVIESRTKEILAHVNCPVLFYSRTKSVTQNIRGFIEKLLRAARRVLGSHMRLSEQWLRNTNINYQRSNLGYRRKIHSTLRHSSS